MRNIIIKIVSLVIIIAIIFATMWASGLFKRTECPDRWEEGYGMPGPGYRDSGPESRIYIKGKMYDANQFNQNWIRKNCSISEPYQLPQ